MSGKKAVPKQFNMHIPMGSSFYEDLDRIIRKWPGRWSIAAVVRKLVADAAGAQFVEEPHTAPAPVPAVPSLVVGTGPVRKSAKDYNPQGRPWKMVGPKLEARGIATLGEEKWAEILEIAEGDADLAEMLLKKAEKEMIGGQA